MSAFKNKASSGGGDFAVPPAGSHPAVLVALVDLGTHTDSYQGNTTTNRKLFLVWELVAEKNPDGSGNFIVGRDYTNSLNEKAALRKLIEQWGGRQFNDDEEFDFLKLLGKKFLLTLVQKKSQNNREYAKIDAVGPVPKGMTVPAATCPPFSWEIGDDPAKLPEWLPYVYGQPVREKIMQSEEMKGGGGGVAAGATADGKNEDDGDDIAF